MNISLKKNFIMNALLTMSSFIFPLITFPYVSRILGPTGTGKVTFVTSIVTYFSLFAQLGIPTYGIRACAKVRDSRIELTRVAQELLLINFITTVISYIAFILCVLFIPKLQEERNLYIIISFTLILTAIGMEWLYKGLEQYSYITKRSIFFKFISVIAMFLLVHEKTDYVIYGGITILAASASNILNFINVRNYIDLKPVGNYQLKRHLKPILVFFALSCATTIYTNLDNVMLGFLASDTDVGYYSASVKIKNILVSLVTSLGAVLLPRASYYIEHKDYDEFNRLSEKALHFVLVIALPLFVYFTLYAKECILFLSGDQYLNAVLPMQLLMPTVLFIGLTNILGIQMLVPLGKEKVVLNSTIAGAIVDVIINAILIPQFQSTGAAIGTLVAEFVVLVWQYFAMKEFVISFIKSIKIIPIIIGIIVSSILSIAFKLFISSVLLKLILSFISFFICYDFVLLIFKEEFFVEMKNQIVVRLSSIRN